MSIVYSVAAVRHLKDADILESAGRDHNAGHLYGVAAECGLKALLVAGGRPVTAGGDLQNHADRKHLPDLQNLISTVSVLTSGRSATKYIAMIPDISNFSDWRVDHRYWVETAVPVTSLPNWKLAASQVGTMLEEAKINGDI